MFTWTDYLSIVIHTLISGLIYTFFIFMYFETGHDMIFGFAIGLICSLYMEYKERTDHLNMNPLMTIYFTIPVILICAPFFGWTLELMIGNRFGYYLGFFLGALITWGFTSYLNCEDYFQLKKRPKSF